MGSGCTGAKVGFHIVVIREKVVAALREEGGLGNMQALESIHPFPVPE